jgi:hypothetical protein
LLKFNRLAVVLILATCALLGNPDTAAAQSLTFSPSPLSVSISGPGGTTTSSVSVSSTASINGSLTVTTISTSDHSNWLCTQTSGTTLTVSIGTGSGCSSSQLLNNQTYTGQVTVTASTATSGNQSGVLNVTLQVGSGGGNSSLVATPNPVNFSVQTGGTAPSQNVNITFNGSAVTVQSVSSTTANGQPWLLASSGNSSVVVSVQAAGLVAGNYTGTVTVGTSAGSLNIPVNLSVGGIPTLNVNPTAVNFAYQTGTNAPLPQTIALTSSGSAVNVTVSASTSSGGTQWLIVSPTGQLTTPTQITVSIQPSGLAAGQTYQGNIQINSSGATNGTVNIPVSLLVSNNPIIAANPASMTFTAQAGGTAPGQNLALTSSGAALSYTVTSSVTTPAGGSWLQVANQSGTTNGTITVNVNTAGLAVGTYTGVINVSAPSAGNTSLSVPVTLNINAGPVLQFSVPSLSFAFQVGQAQPQSQTVVIGSASGTVGFSVTTQTANMGSWLTVSPTNGSAPGNLVVSVNTAGLAVGTYTGTISITPSGGATNTPQTIPVTLVVSNTALFVLSPSAATFTDTIGSSGSSFQNLAVTSTDGTAIPFSVVANTSVGSNWLLVSSNSGTTPTNLSITANPAGLAVGTYTGSVTITATAGTVANSPQTFPVTLNVVSSNTLSVTPASLTFTQATGGSSPPSQTLSVTSTGASGTGGQITFAATVSLNQGAGWLTVTPSNATTPATLTVTANGASLTAGTYTGQITLSSPGVTSQTVNVTLNVGSGGGGFTNSGSMAQVASAGLAATGNWTTTFTMVNNGTGTTQVHMNFFDDNGNPLALPLIFPQSSPTPGAPAASFDHTLNAGQLLIVQTTGPTTQAVQTGWAQLLYNGNVGAYAVFGQSVSGASTQEAVVPLETRTTGSFVIPFDSTAGYATGVAVANISTQAANIPVIIRDDNGNVLQSTTLALAAHGHTSFALASRYSITAQGRGTLEFQTPAGGQISVLGLRFPPGPAFSTIPALGK